MTGRSTNSDPISIFRGFAGAFALGLMLTALGALSSAKTHGEVLDATVAKARSELRACDVRTRKEQAARIAAASIGTIWQARVSVYQAADDIRSRNFGTAERNLKNAARLIDAACIDGACPGDDLVHTMTIHTFSEATTQAESLAAIHAFGAAIDNLVKR
jgi:hypothetical protein